MKLYLAVLKRYSAFAGRSGRKEFWTFLFIQFGILVLFSVLDAIAGGTEKEPTAFVGILGLYIFATLLPTIGVTVRRIQDSDHSGLWLFVPFVNFVMCCLEGTPGDNRFGPNPAIQAQSAPVMANTAVACSGRALSAEQIPANFCISCGTRFPEVARFCPTCGAARMA